MLKRLIDQLVAEAAKKPEAKASLPGRHFITVWRRGGRYHLRISWTARMDHSLPGLVAQAAGWEDWRHEIGASGLEYSGIPSVPDQPAPAKPTAWRIVTHEDLKELHAVRSNEGLSHDDVKALIKNIWGLNSTTALNVAQMRELIDTILPQGRATIAARNWYRKGA